MYMLYASLGHPLDDLIHQLFVFSVMLLEYNTEYACKIPNYSQIQKQTLTMSNNTHQ